MDAELSRFGFEVKMILKSENGHTSNERVMCPAAGYIWLER